MTVCADLDWHLALVCLHKLEEVMQMWYVERENEE